jgi:hypothetical protein
MVNSSLISLGWPHFAFPAADTLAHVEAEIGSRPEVCDVVARLEKILELLKTDQQAA